MNVPLSDPQELSLTGCSLKRESRERAVLRLTWPPSDLKGTNFGGSFTLRCSLLQEFEDCAPVPNFFQKCAVFTIKLTPTLDGWSLELVTMPYGRSPQSQGVKLSAKVMDVPSHPKPRPTGQPE